MGPSTIILWTGSLVVLHGTCLAFLSPVLFHGPQQPRHRKTFLSERQKATLDRPVVLRFNRTSLLQIGDGEDDDSIRFHLQRLYDDAMLAASAPQEAPYATNTDVTTTVSGTGSSQTKCHPALEPFRLFLKPYSPLCDDMDHHGRFAVPLWNSENNGKEEPQGHHATMPSNVAFAVPNPLSFLRDDLSVATNSLETESSSQTTTGEGIVVLSNLHQSLPSAWQQLEYISRVWTVEGLAPKLSLLHVGTSTRKGTNGGDDSILVKPTRSDTLEALNESHLLLPPMSTIETQGQVRIRRADLDVLRAVLCGYNPSQSSTETNDAVVETLIKLIDASVRSPQRPRLVLVCSSVQCRYVATAIAEWKDRITSSSGTTTTASEKEARGLLQQGLTVLTMGSLDFNFPRGPCYVHVAMLDDDLAIDALGRAASARRDDEDDDAAAAAAGQAVVLKGMSPYLARDDPIDEDSTDALSSRDAHNPLVCSFQFLHLVLRINGASTIRQLYEQGVQPAPQLDISPSQCTISMPYYGQGVGVLDLPQDEILWAVLEATHAQQWLWNPLLGDVLPAPEFAEATVTEYFGYGVYEELRKLCAEARTETTEPQ